MIDSLTSKKNGKPERARATQKKAKIFNHRPYNLH